MENSDVTAQNVEEIISTLGTMARSISQEYEDCAISERKNANQQIDNFCTEVEQILSRYVGGISRGELRKFQDLLEQVVGDSINKSRLYERNGTVTRLGQVRADKLEVIVSRIEQYKEEGPTEDNNFEQKMDEITNSIKTYYQKMLLSRQSKGTDRAFEEIIQEAKVLRKRIVARNEDNTKTIETSFRKRITAFETILKQLETQSTNISSKLKSGVNTPEKIISYDKQDIEEGKDSPESEKSDLAAIFK